MLSNEWLNWKWKTVYIIWVDWSRSFPIWPLCQIWIVLAVNSTFCFVDQSHIWPQRGEDKTSVWASLKEWGWRGQFMIQPRFNHVHVTKDQKLSQCAVSFRLEHCEISYLSPDTPALYYAKIWLHLCPSSVRFGVFSWPGFWFNHSCPVGINVSTLSASYFETKKLD